MPRKQQRGSAHAGKGKSKNLGFEEEVTANLTDVLCTWILLAGMSCTVIWSEFAIPRMCSRSSGGKFLTFSCEEGVVFSYIFSLVAITTYFLPPHTTNPMELLFVQMPVKRRAVKFVLQLGAAAVFAAAVKRIGVSPVAEVQFADKVYRDALPKINLCTHPTATSFHRSIVKPDACVPVWPSLSSSGFSMGAVLNEALHTLLLNLVASFVCPRVGSFLPFAVATCVVTTIRSPIANTGPALNMVPAVASAFLHGGLDALRVHLLGTLIGVMGAYLLEKRSGILVGSFRSVWSLRSQQESSASSAMQELLKEEKRTQPSNKKKVKTT
ncbi:hypothetical protein GUITHDRAFT_138891 [Guillardia theta CCMP2712]|uniref:Aquaporin n=1 Tax=Guillardia theta (strain CCMP2712) TaxID=905079 RepID=L1JAX1_GUITC|nr:hypothetical protein GUITHDRAFT_138891 [Guillardia theta CCMP2712]EKX45688.1 hypothetical protein GUITHDRAFT_138891 [Guillardia theta CCMP2712]|eukprot:XP_005832668.1 hypothetical protein GUITHDRAFT_138891 [Guillardia theta CCMP2712]